MTSPRRGDFTVPALDVRKRSLMQGLTVGFADPDRIRPPNRTWLRIGQRPARVGHVGVQRGGRTGDTSGRARDLNRAVPDAASSRKCSPYGPAGSAPPPRRSRSGSACPSPPRGPDAFGRPASGDCAASGGAGAHSSGAGVRRRRPRSPPSDDGPQAGAGVEHRGPAAAARRRASTSAGRGPAPREPRRCRRAGRRATSPTISPERERHERERQHLDRQPVTGLREEERRRSRPARAGRGPGPAALQRRRAIATAMPTSASPTIARPKPSANASIASWRRGEEQRRADRPARRAGRSASRAGGARDRTGDRPSAPRAPARSAGSNRIHSRAMA